MKAVAVLPDGRIAVLDAQAQEIRIFAPDGEHGGTLGHRGEGPGELADANGMVTGPDGLEPTLALLGDDPWNVIKVLDPDGGWADTVRLRPSEPSTGEETPGEYRVVQTTFEGDTLLAFESQRTPRPVSAEERDSVIVMVRDRTGGEEDDRGRLWVRVAGPCTNPGVGDGRWRRGRTFMKAARRGGPPGRWFLALLVTTAGCGSGSEADPPYLARDSAGTTVVVSQHPMWGEGEGWSVSERPRLEIGVFEGEEAYQLADVRGVTRLSDGRIAVLNGGDVELRFYDPAGRFVRTGAGPGQGPGEIDRPTGLLRLDGDTLVVPQRADWEASWFTGQGTFLRRERLDAARHGEAIDSLWGCPRRPGLLPDATLLVCAGSGVERHQQEAAPRVSHWLVRSPYDASWVDTLGTFYGFAPSLAFGARGTGVAAGGAPLRIFVGDPAFFEIDVIEDRAGRVLSMRYPDGLEPVSARDREAYEEYMAEWLQSRPPGAPAAVSGDRTYARHRPGSWISTTTPRDTSGPPSTGPRGRRAHQPWSSRRTDRSWGRWSFPPASRSGK